MLDLLRDVHYHVHFQYLEDRKETLWFNDLWKLDVIDQVFKRMVNKSVKLQSWVEHKGMVAKRAHGWLVPSSYDDQKVRALLEATYCLQVKQVTANETGRAPHPMAGGRTTGGHEVLPGPAPLDKLDCCMFFASASSRPAVEDPEKLV